MQLSASSSSEPELDDDLKSPISLVHERALRRGLTVQFEVVRETGPPHMRTFLTRCRVGEFATQGAGNGKKVRGDYAIASLQHSALPLLPYLSSVMNTRCGLCFVKSAN